MSDNALKVLRTWLLYLWIFLAEFKRFNEKFYTICLKNDFFKNIFEKYLTLRIFHFYIKEFTFNGFSIFGHLKHVNVDVSHFRRFDFVLQFLKLCIFQSFQESCFSCMCTSNYDASNMGYVNFFFAEKLFKFLFIYLCFFVFYLKDWMNKSM